MSTFSLDSVRQVRLERDNYREEAKKLRLDLADSQSHIAELESASSDANRELSRTQPATHKVDQDPDNDHAMRLDSVPIRQVRYPCALFSSTQ